MGSGTTLVAAMKEGRRAVGYDLDPRYVEIARERIRREARRAVPVVDAKRPGSLEVPRDVAEPAENFQARATQQGRVAQEIARKVLEDAGFVVVEKGHRLRGLGVQFNFLVTDRKGTQWYVDVTGAFTTTRGGLLRTDSVWKTLGRALVLREELERQGAAGSPPRLLLLTSHLPKRGSEGDKALHAAGTASFWDAVEMLSEAGRARLCAYASGDHDRPLPGFWSEAEIERLS